ncbi:Gti1/Pac2 family-domain-containing protein, partial [Cladorrhinum samala]
MSSPQKQPNGRRHTTCGTQGEQELPIKPAWQGYIKNSVSACVLMTAALKGFVQHMPRRPGEGERAELIKSGNIFIYQESVSNIRRWTDGLNWSPSRILGNFLVYRELSEPFPAGQKKKALKKHQNRNASRAEAKAKTTNPLIPEEDMRKLVGSLTDSYDFKEDGLVKKTISITVKGQIHHIVSYYKPMDVYRKKLYDVCDDPFFHDCVPPLDMLNPTAFR